MNRDTAHELLFHLLRPLARLCLRHGLYVQDLLEAAKRALLAEAQAQLEPGATMNASRLSAATGIHRRDVTRITVQKDDRREPQGLIGRILGQWQHDRRFCSSRGRPRPLTYGADGSEFHTLVEAVSKDLHAGTILSELERLNIVDCDDETVTLLTDVFSSRADAVAGYRMLARDTSTLFAAVEANIANPEAPPHLHGTTFFDNIRADALPEIREWLLHEGSKLHRRVRAYLARFDLDVAGANPPARNRRIRVPARGGGCVTFTTVSLSVEKEEVR